MMMQATVLSVEPNRLLVFDHATRQQVLVNVRCACRIRPGDFVRIWYSGAMTMSIPPQITAQHISVNARPFSWRNWSR